MGVQAKVRELAVLLRRTPELQGYYRVQEELERNLEARRLMRYYQRAQEKLQALWAKGEVPAEYMLRDYENLRQECQDNSLIQRYLQSREQAVGLINKIFDHITRETGIPAGGCGGCGRQRG